MEGRDARGEGRVGRQKDIEGQRAGRAWRAERQ